MQKHDAAERECSICGAAYSGRGHNAAPVTGGYCCEDCQQLVVTPARLWRYLFQQHLSQREKL